MTLFLVAVLLVILLAIAALAIDLSRLYVARSEAQRAADAAALAAAKTFVDEGFLSGFLSQFEVEILARVEAKTVGGQNLVAGQAPVILDGDVTFDFSNPDNPRVTVHVERSAARANAVPNFFARATGFLESDISADATAEAYAPADGSIPVGTGCVKPWILPNCEPADLTTGFVHTAPANPNCTTGTGQTYSYLVDPTTGQVVWPGAKSSGGVVGYNFILKPGNPNETDITFSEVTPGQFYPVQIPPGDEPALCPDCAQNSGGSEGPGAALYRHNIACCNTNQFVCGQQVQIDEQTGNMVGPTRQGVQCLINQVPQNCVNSKNCGQDYITDPDLNPFRFTGGSNNPNPALVGQTISSSSSVVVVPLYDGYPLTPGESGALPLVTIRGFVQLFIEKVGPPQGTTKAYILNVAGCGSDSSGSGTGGTGGGSGTPGGGVLTGPAGSPYPIRLVRPGS
jgi:hypothetical protein